MGRLRRRQPGAYYLRCSKHATKSRDPEVYGCHANTIDESYVLAAVGEWLAEIATPETIDQALANSTGQDKLEAELADLRRLAEDREQKRRRLAHALAAGSMDPQVYHDVDTEILAELEAAELRAEEIRAMLVSLPDPGQRRAHLEALAADAFRLAEMDRDAVNAALRGAGVRVYCEDREIAIIGLEL